MASDYCAIRQKNIEEYGKGIRHLSHFADMYSARTHFIYELLQNAEDAMSRRPPGAPSGFAHFTLHHDRLELVHNGKPFDTQDVTGICGIGEGAKSGDYTQIGKFGIGFKSVYAYSFFPRVYSGDEALEIRRFVEPHEAPLAELLHRDEVNGTLIVLPFDADNNRPEWAFRRSIPPETAVAEIGKALRDLGARTLLFLRCIEEIRWELADRTKGHFLRSTERLDQFSNLRIVTVTDGEDIEEWYTFEHCVPVQENDEQHEEIVEVAFLVKDGKVVRAENTELVAYFQTARETKLGFLIQGRFKTTKARDNIKADDPANWEMIKCAASLAADSLDVLRDLDLLDVGSYDALPLCIQDFPEEGFFRPVFDRIREALRTRQLLPKQGGGFVAAKDAKLARGARLVELFDFKQLGQIHGRDRLEWLDATITEATPLYEYIAGRRRQYSQTEWVTVPLIDDALVDADKIASKLSSDFLETQSDEWIIRFYEYIQNAGTFKTFEKIPLLRLQPDDKHVPPYGNDGNTPTAYLPPTSGDIDASKFKFIKKSIASNEAARKFLLEVVNLREPDRDSVVIECIVPRYANLSIPFSEETYIADLQQISEAFRQVTGDARSRLIATLQSTAFIACSIAGDISGASIVWKRPGDKAIFRHSEDLETWFENDDSGAAYFPLPYVNNLDGDLCSKLNLASGTLIECLRSYPWPRHNHYRRPEGGFDGTADIVGLKSALATITEKKAAFLWNILLNNVALVRGREVLCRNGQFPIAKIEEVHVSTLAEACIAAKWLPVNGTFFQPVDVLLFDLPPEFERDTPRAELLSRALGMKQPEREQALEVVTGGDENLKRLIEHYRSAPESEREKMLELVSSDLPSVQPPAFQEVKKWRESRKKPNRPEDESIDRVHRDATIEEEVSEASVDAEERMQSIRTAEPGLRADIREYLRAQNSNNDQELVCQLCHEVMPFKIRNEYYFEAVECVGRIAKKLRYNHLALCANCAAKYEWANAHTAKEIHALILDAAVSSPDIPITLAGDPNHVIHFTKKHLGDLQVVLRYLQPDL